jgi:hypothetical protein
MKEKENIFADLAEQLIFLKELGVDSIDAELPEAEPFEDPEIPHSEFQTYAPKAGELKAAAAKPSISDEKSAPRKEEILRSMRLADFDKRDRRSDTGGAPVTKESTRPEPAPVPSAGTSLFADSSRGLAESNESLSDVHSDIGADCKRCRLCEKRTQVVNSVGNPNADLMFIGEAPGADEDIQGEPFVGRAGQLLTKIIEAIDL